jgi:hypothetical protein
MRRAIATLALAISLAGCGLVPTQGEPFELVTSWEPGSAESPGSCRPGWGTVGLLVIDPERGTAIKVDGGDFLDTNMGTTMPVLWWPTFTARRLGDVVSVIDPDGNVVATTGRRYRIAGSFEPVGFVACGADVLPL